MTGTWIWVTDPTTEFFIAYSPDGLYWWVNAESGTQGSWDILKDSAHTGTTWNQTMWQRTLTVVFNWVDASTFGLNKGLIGPCPYPLTDSFTR